MKSSIKSRPASVFIIVLVLIMIEVVPVLSLSAQTVNATAKTIVVPDSYATINAAIGNAAQGDTILVRGGTYYENVVIDKPLAIIGEGSRNTVIIGSGGAPNVYIFNVSASNVRISGFTIKSLNYSLSKPTYFASGIGIAGDNCSITDSNIATVYRGIYVGGWGDLCGGKSSTVISGNNITGPFSDGIRLFGGSRNTISSNNIVGGNASGIAIEGYLNQILGNNLEGNRRGMGLSSANTVIFGNKIADCIDWGIYFQASNSIISANYVSGNRWGVFLSPAFPPKNNTFYHNNFVNNTKHIETGTPYSVQVWDNGYPSGGNYWNNYNGKDDNGDGVGDTPFNVGPNNTDKYPLFAPFDVSNAGIPPSASPPSPVQAGHTVALWHFDEVEPDGVTHDATGNNPIFLGSATGNISCPPRPTLVAGKFGQALNFDIPQYGYAFASSSLDVPQEITIDAWIKVIDFQNTTFNNIVVQCARTLDKYPARIYGLSLNGMYPENATSGPLGALSGYLYTDSGYNEIVTLNSAINLNQWTHVMFIRSLATGMHIYVDGVDQPVKVNYGSQNPQGNIKKGNEFDLGHDYIGVIDEVRISSIAEGPQPETQSTALWAEWWFWIEIVALVTLVAAAAFFLKRSNNR